jgi:hypothetical protein
LEFSYITASFLPEGYGLAGFGEIDDIATNSAGCINTIMESFSCPFCDFTDHDSYFLLQHVELIHPENGESPFIATERDEAEDRSSSSSEKDNEKEAAPRPEQTHSSSVAESLSPRLNSLLTQTFI